jgi:hypothetical protein
MLNSTRDRISSSFVIAINFNSWHIAFLVAYCICLMVEFHTTVKISDVGGLFRPRKFSTIIVSTLRLKPSTGLTSPVSGVDYHLVGALILTVLIRHKKDCDFDITLTQPFTKIQQSIDGILLSRKPPTSTIAYFGATTFI